MQQSIPTLMPQARAVRSIPSRWLRVRLRVEESADRFIWTNKNGAQGVDNRGTGLLGDRKRLDRWNNSTNPTIVCSYIAVDSIIGQQLFYARRRRPSTSWNQRAQQE